MYNIYTAKESSFEQWRTMWLAYLAVYLAPIPSAMAIENLWRRLLDPDSTESCILIQTEADEVCGFAHCLTHSSTWTDKPVCYLQDLYIKPEYRKKGLAQKLVRHIYESSHQAGHAKLYWQTQQDNHRARQFYDKLTGGTDGLITYHLSIREQLNADV